MAAIRCMEQICLLKHKFFGPQSEEVLVYLQVHASVVNRLANVYTKNGDFSGAISILRQLEDAILLLAPNTPMDEPVFSQLLGVAYNNLGICYGRSGKPRAAMLYFDRSCTSISLSVTPGTTCSHLNSCILLSASGRHREAESHARMALNIARDAQEYAAISETQDIDAVSVLIAPAHFYVGKEMLHLHKYDTAADHLSQAHILLEREFGEKHPMAIAAANALHKAEHCIHQNSEGRRRQGPPTGGSTRHYPSPQPFGEQAPPPRDSGMLSSRSSLSSSSISSYRGGRDRGAPRQPPQLSRSFEASPRQQGRESSRQASTAASSSSYSSSSMRVYLPQAQSTGRSSGSYRAHDPSLNPSSNSSSTRSQQQRRRDEERESSFSSSKRPASAPSHRASIETSEPPTLLASRYLQGVGEQLALLQVHAPGLATVPDAQAQLRTYLSAIGKLMASLGNADDSLRGGY